MAHNAEHAVDLETGTVVGVTIQGADAGDTTTVVETLVTAAEQVEAVLPTESGVADVVADKGYHSNETMVDLAAVGVRSYIAEPDRGRQCWQDAPEARDAVCGNRRRIRGNRGRAPLRRPAELLERPFVHLYDIGGMRRVHLPGYSNILKRVLVHVAGGNLGLLLRHLTGVGTPRGPQGRVVSAVWALIRRLVGLCGAVSSGSWRRFCQICRLHPRYRAVRPSSPPFEHRGLPPRAARTPRELATPSSYVPDTGPDQRSGSHFSAADCMGTEAA